ncbi:uncharacterized protein PHALS_02129 [Plasmopara halstedii]|uniref:Uncharacterized protein n=1 Tax=Plasmopara halstedii TaxID=4781 RepID=A0A0P1AWE5_PLAHL|nr:uncharacterized protein PHALS_02129 [Plasmopara halstedii]CEG45856.1 hypothetical protein PHALS_02129 [Plasmopara halstedii]|eukprot:XP_024582225.1 hypothetical protein PHALS_02129 [Plasmopara halstedii]
MSPVRSRTSSLSWRESLKATFACFTLLMDCHTTATCWLKLDRPGGDPNQRLGSGLLII